MSTRPKFHKIVSEQVDRFGSTVYTLQYNPALFENAKCKDLDTELFYPLQEKFDLTEERYIRDRLCGGCPVQEACLEWGLVHERFGIWGGTTAYRRTFMRKVLRWAFNDIALRSTQR
jgi:hypothetical protein